MNPYPFMSYCNYYCYYIFILLSGHNSLDDPSLTQPLVYDLIKEHPTPLHIYATKLINTNPHLVCDMSVIDAMKESVSQGIVWDYICYCLFIYLYLYIQLYLSIMLICLSIIKICHYIL